MKLIVAAILPLATLSACGGEANEGTGTAYQDPATTDLNVNSDATEANQAVNQLDQQSNLDEMVGDAGNGAANTVQ